MKQNKKEELQSRREFFKKAAKVLSIFGIITMVFLPNFVNADVTAVDSKGNIYIDHYTTITKDEVISIGGRISKSSNNDKYWYGRYVSGRMDNNGIPIEESFKYIYPDNNCHFEVRFAYTDDSKFPMKIYLLEINDDVIVKSKYIGHLNASIKSSLGFKSNGVNIYTPGYHVHVQSDGTIIIYDTPNGSYANESFKIFKPTEAASVIYKVRYDVLIDKLKGIIERKS